MSHPDSARSYFRLLLREVFKHSWGGLDYAATACAVFIPVVLRFYPKMEPRLTPLYYEIPLALFVALGVVRVIAAPYWIYQERHQAAKQREAELSREIVAAKSERQDEIDDLIQKSSELTRQYDARRPQLTFTASGLSSREWIQSFGGTIGAVPMFHVRHCSGETAEFVEVQPIDSTLKNFTLIFDPIPRCGADHLEHARWWVCENKYPDHCIDDNRDLQMLAFFFRDKPANVRVTTYDVTIRFQWRGEKLERRLKLRCDYPDLRLSTFSAD